jgi:hypothetical protein
MYLQLGENAGMFFDPTSRVKINPGQMVEITSVQANSKKLKKALAGGHIQRVSKEEFEKCQKKVSVKDAASKESTFPTAVKEETPKAKTPKADDLISNILENFEGYTKKELKKKSVKELQAILAD